MAMQYCSRCVVDTERGKVRDGEIDFLRENAKHVDTKSSAPSSVHFFVLAHQLAH